MSTDLWIRKVREEQTPTNAIGTLGTPRSCPLSQHFRVYERLASDVGRQTSGPKPCLSLLATHAADLSSVGLIDPTRAFSIRPALDDSSIKEAVCVGERYSSL